MIVVGFTILIWGLAQVSEVSAVGECAQTMCSNQGMCFDYGYYGTYTCSCDAGFQGRDCELEQNGYQLCPNGNVYERNDVIASEGPLAHRFSCITFVNIHGADVVNLTVNYFDFEPAKDSLDIGIGYFEDFNDPSYISYDNDSRLTSMQVMSANFYIIIFTDKNIVSGGYNISLSADGDDCLSVLEPCMNGGTCVDEWQNYTCSCAQGYEGRFCEVDADACRSDPCLNGGTCNTLPTGYTCDCTASYTGFNCETGIVIVDLTTPSVASSFQVYEGFTLQSLAFDLTFSPSPLATFSIGGGTDSGLWQVTGYFSPNANGIVIVGGQTVSLTTAQQATLWAPPADTTISSIEAPSITVPSAITCPQMQYFCARLDRGPNPSPNFELMGDPTDMALLGCTSVTCRGVEISSSTLTITSGELQEGISGQTVSFNFNMQSVADAGAVSGTNLWQFTAFGSQNAAGTGTPTFTANVPVTTQGSVGVSPGSVAQFNSLSFNLDLSGNINCDSVQYICVTAAKGPNASPDFTLTGVPDDGVFTACQAVTCRGVELTSSSVSVTGFLREGLSNNLPFSLSISSDAQAGTAVGSGLWKVTAYASASSSGTGTRYGQTSITLNPSQSGTTLNAGSTATLSALSFPLNLQNGPTCSQISYVCATIEKGDSAFPDFDLTPSASTACTPVNCRGVEITGTSLTITSGDVREGVSGQSVIFNFLMNPSSTSGAVSGSNLWSFTAFGSDNVDGTSPSTSTYNVALGGQGGLGVTPGSISQFSGLNFLLDLSGNLNCDDLPYICVTAAKGSSANPDFTLTGVPNDDVFTACQQVTCRGVNIISSTTSVTGGVNEGQSNNVPFSVTLNANPSGGTATGNGLWMITAYASANSDGTGTRYDERSISLSSSQAGTTLNYNSPATISGLLYPLDLTNGPACSMFSYICSVVEKGNNPSPDFDLTPTSITSCTQVDCSGVEISATSLSLTSGELQEGESGQTVTFNFNANSVPNTGSISGSNLWQFTVFGSQNSDGSGVQTSPTSISLTPSQGSTSIISGQVAQFFSLNYNLDLSGNVNCDDVPYICATIGVHANANPSFRLSGNPDDSVLTACQAITCRGVEIISSSLAAPAYVLEGESNSVDLSFSLTSDANGGTAIGTGLWKATAFASADPNGNGQRFDEQSIPLSASQASTLLNAGIPTTISGLPFVLDTRNSPTCSQFDYICVEIEKGDNPLPDFDLDPAIIRACSQVECRGVDVSQLSISVDNNEVFHGQTNNVILDVTALANPNYGSVSGNNLWILTTWLSNNQLGTGRLEQNNPTLRQDLLNLPINSGQPSVFMDVNYLLDLSVSPTCTEFSYICVELARNPGASVDFELTGDLMTCIPLTCTDINECESGPCLNGGTCNDLVNGYTCMCRPGFTGVFCQININECISAPCQNGGTCFDRVNSYMCQCVPGYTGTNCQTNINECASNPCQNGATCTDLVNAYSCACLSGYTGPLCSININECQSSPCENGGTCTDFVNYYQCACLPGFTGTNCQTNIDECASVPCQNGGTCNDGINGFTCTCRSGFTGTFCQIDIDECASNPCSQGNCIDRVNAYECVCFPGYDGINCNNNIDECASGPCLNGGQCIDEINMFRCNCVPGYTGVLCGIDINECQSGPCRNGGSCVDQVNQYTCNCQPGYTGTNCEININECLSGPCLNGGTCLDGINRYTCQCAPGFTGTFCHINIDECASDPCLNGGTCVDGVNMYTCQCTSEWTGTRCELSLNACRSNPCQYGGTCVNTGINYVCECNPGYAGTNCEININECASLPCQNGGRCIDGIAMFTCQCPQGFSGTTCQDVGFCDLEGEWYNEVNDKVTISRTSTGMILGDYQNSVELLTGYSAPTVVVGYANQNCDFPSFGFVVTRDNGKSTTSWSGQCHLCDGEEVLYTTWTNTERVSTCSEVKRATLIGQDKWTRYQQSTAPREDP